MRRAGSVHQLPHSDPVRTLHPIISSLYTQFAALYLRLDQRLDELDQQVLREADDEELAEITAIRHRAGMSRRMLIPGRNLAARMPLIRSLPGATSEKPALRGRHLRRAAVSQVRLVMRRVSGQEG